MTKKIKYDVYADLTEKVLDQYCAKMPDDLKDQGAYEFGALIATATMRVPQRGLYPDDFVNQKRREYQTARVQLRKFDGGDELIRMEEDLYLGLIEVEGFEPIDL